MSQGRRRFEQTTAKPSRTYVVFVAVMAAFLVIGSVALIAGSAFMDSDTDQSDSDEADRPGEEVSRLETAVAGDPADTDSMAVLANILANSGRPDEAITWYERAVDANPEDGDLRTAFGLALFQLENDFDASIQLRRAHDLLPNSATPPFYLGQISERADEVDLDEARGWYKKAIEIAPESFVGEQAQGRLDALDVSQVTPTP